MLNTKPESLQEMDDTALATRKADAAKLDGWAHAQFSLKGILGWALGGLAIAGTLAFFGMPLLVIAAPIAAAITIIPPAAGYLATFYTSAELKRITDTIEERKRPKQKIEVIFEDGTKSVIAASPASALGNTFAAKATPSTEIAGLLPAPPKEKPVALLTGPKTTVA
jgi:hypothetical protein